MHAHPDDESLWTGLSLAAFAAAGDDVHVLTCTLGEEGEVIPPGLAHLEGAPGDPLGPHRLGELRVATAHLGVQSRLLAPAWAPDRPWYRDSGMAGSAAARHPRAFAGAPLPEVADRVRAVITELRPAVVVTYDQAGGYGHPDHIRCHDAVVAAVRGIPVHQRPLTYAVLTPQSWAREDRRWLAAADLPGDWTVLSDPGSYPPSVVPDEVVTHATVAPEQVATQAEALRAHETQVIVTDGAWALSNLEAGRLSGREGFALINVDTGALVTSPLGVPDPPRKVLGDGRH